MCDHVKKDGGAGPIIKHKISEAYIFSVGKSEGRIVLKKKFGSLEYWKNYARSRKFEDVVWFHLGYDKVRKRAIYTLMNSLDRRGKGV